MRVATNQQWVKTYGKLPWWRSSTHLKKLLKQSVESSTAIELPLFKADFFSQESHSFASTQLDLPGSLQAKCRAWVLAHVVQEDFSSLESQDGAFHITVRYGLHDPDIREINGTVNGLGPVNIELGRIAQFESDQYDVLIVPVINQEGLLTLRSVLSSLPHTETHADYHPHVTLAYVKKGAGTRYLGDASFLGDTAVLDRVRYSDSQGSISWVSLLPTALYFSQLKGSITQKKLIKRIEELIAEYPDWEREQIKAVLRQNGKPADVEEKALAHADQPELNRELTSYEKKVDFAVIDLETKKLASQGIERMKQLLTESREKLLALISSRYTTRTLSAKFVLDLELRGLGRLIPTLREVLGASFRLGQREAAKELKKTFAQYGWNEADHPRVPAGSSEGGQFESGGDRGSKETQWEFPTDLNSGRTIESIVYRNMDPIFFQNLVSEQVAYPGAIAKNGPYELRTVPIDKIKASQSGEDFINDSSRQGSRVIQTLRSGGYQVDGELDIDLMPRLKDFAPVLVDTHYRLIDGNHRLASHQLAGEKFIVALVPKKVKKFGAYYPYAFDPSQPRDEDGKWSAEGGGGGSSEVSEEAPSFGEWAIDLQNRDLIGYRAAGSQGENLGKMAATEGVGPYISKEPNLASQFGRAQKVYFPKPKNPMIVNEEPLHILHETDEIMQQSSPKDSPWLSANKAAVRLAKVTDKNWPQKVESGALPEALTEVLRQRGHDAVLVRSGGEEWAVLLPKMKGSKVSLRTTRIFQIKLDPTGLPPEKALEFFERKAVLWGADIRQPLLGQVKNILFDGIKQGTSLRDLMMRIREAYLPWLGDPDQAIDEIMLTPYRLETLVRTNITEALNEGRKAQFQSAVDDGFVIGLQYSAILDDRTCFRAGTKIRMASGNSLPIEQILPGDMILAGSGISRQVLGLKRYVANKWRRIKTDIGAEVLCTETHPFWTEQGWREAHEIRIGETLGANLFGVRKSRDGFPGEEPPQDLRKDMPIYSGPSYQVQQADSADMQEVRELDSRFKRIREKTQVLLCEMLSDAGGKSRETMCPMRKEDGTFGSLCEKESRSEEMLLKCMLSDISQAWGAEGIDRDPMRNMSATFSGKSWNHSEREAETALLSCVSKEARKSELPSMQEDIRDETTGGSEILLSSMLSEIETGNPDRGNGSCGIGALWDSISAGGSTGSVCTGLSSSRTSLGNRGRRGILASERLFRQEGTGHQGGGITVIPNSSGRGFGSIQAGPIEGVDCAPCPAPVEWAKVAANDPLDELAIAYDIEVAQDHCYLAEGLIAHNTEVCRHLDQKIFSPNSPDLDRLTPPRHWNCRSLLTPVTRIEGPVQYISPAQVAKGIELSGKGFSQENLTQAYAFDPNQPRDEDGKWSAEGGGSNAKTEDAIRGDGSGKDKTFVNADGSPVDAATQDRIKALGLPPAWTNVQVSADPKSPLQAIGTDASGKEQYRYSKQWRTERNAAKHLRVAALAQDGYKTMVKGVERDLRQGKEEAVVMSLVLSTAMRIGGRSEKAIGATTLEAQHLSVSGDLVRFAFPGKSGKQWEGTIRNEALAKQISMRLKGKSGTDRVFGVTAIKVNTYLKQYGQMSAKDVRTLQGTAIAHKVAKELGMPTTVKEAKGYIKTISIKVAEHLRNTPAVAKSSYINPAIWAPIQAKFGISVLK